MMLRTFALFSLLWTLVASFTPSSWSPMTTTRSMPQQQQQHDPSTNPAAWALMQSSRTLTLPVPDTTSMVEPYQFNQPASYERNNNNNKSVLLQRRNAVAPALATISSPSASPAAKIVQSFQKKLEKWGGLSTVMSYYFVSHINSAITLTLSWYIHAARTGMSPLAPGQYKIFLSIYSGFFVFSNVIRPLRVAGAVALSPTYGKFMRGVSSHFGCTNRIQSILLTVLLSNVAVSGGIVVAGITAASAVTGVPVFPAAL